MEFKELREEYNSFVNEELNKLFRDSLPSDKNLCIFFYTNNMPISTIKQEFNEYLKKLLEKKQVFTIKDKIKEISFKISLYEKKEEINQGIWGGLVPTSLSQIKLI